MKSKRKFLRILSLLTFTVMALTVLFSVPVNVSAGNFSRTDVHWYNGNIYFFLTDSLNAPTAQLRCTEYGGHLVTFETQAEYQFIKDLQNQYGYDTVIIGLNDTATEGTWKWVDGTSPTFTNWNSGEPNNSGDEDYVTSSKSGGWNDINGSSKYFSVCEIEMKGLTASSTWSINGRRYELYKKALCATDAMAFAQSKGGKLITIHSPAENQKYIDMLSAAGAATGLLGANDSATEGSFIWHTGEYLCYSNWASGEPNDSDGEDFSVINVSNGLWNDVGNSTWAYFAVEYADTYTPAATTVFNRHLYLLYNQPLTPIDAEKFCKAKGGHLASVTSAEEQNAVYSLLTSTGFQAACIGFNDVIEEGYFRWTSLETPSQYTNWKSGEPSNSSGTEDWTMMYGSNNSGQWNDFSGAYALPFVMEVAFEDMAEDPMTKGGFYNGSYYQVINVSKNAPDAERYCAALGGHLVSITNESENNFVLSLLNKYSIDTCLIGFNDAATEGTFVWTSGEAATYTNWSSGEPNDSGGEDYATISRSTGKWNDINGSTGYSYIIEYDNGGINTPFYYNGSYYILCRETRNYPAARDACAQMGGHLATVSSASENAFLQNLLQAYGAERGYIGFDDITTEGSFVWVTGESVSYTNWNSGEPNNSSNEDYAVLMASNGLWNDSRDDNYYFCEFEMDKDYGAVAQRVYNGHVYIAFQEKVTYAQAEEICNSMGGHLATISDETENGIVTSLAAQADADMFYIGFDDRRAEGMFKWITGEAVSYMNWQTGEPNNSNGLEDATVIFTASGKWNDCDETSTNGFICELDTESLNHLNQVYYNNNMYRVYNEKLGWYEAKLYSEVKGGHLVSITSAGEQAAVSNLLSTVSSNAYFIGLNADGNRSWKWVTGEGLGYTNWAAGEPNNSGGIEGEYFSNIASSTGLWNDCGNSQGVIYGFVTELENYPKVTATFCYPNGSVIRTQQVVKTMTVTKPVDPTRVGYTFGGWYMDSACNYAWDFANDTIACDTPIYAKWIPITYNVVYTMGSAGSGSITDTATYDAPFTLRNASAFTYTGYTLTKWLCSKNSVNYNPSQTGIVNLTSTAGENVTMTAQWTPNNYSVVYHNDAGAAAYTQSCTYDRSYNYYTAVNAATVTKTGYTLSGWSTSRGAGTADFAVGAAFSNIASADGAVIDLYPVWTANTYYVVYTDTDGSEATQTCFYDTNYTYLTSTLAPGVAQTGYTNNGWADTAGSSAVTHAFSSAFINLTSTPNGIIRVYPVYTPNSYTITYDYAGGTAGETGTSSATYDVGFTVAKPTKNGNNFGGWILTGLDSAPHVYGTSPANYSTSTQNTFNSSAADTWFMNLRGTTGTVKFTAKWEPVHSVITLNGNGATEQTQTSVTGTYGETIPTVSIPGRSYTVTYKYNNSQADSSASSVYTFLGYFTAPTGGVKKINVNGTGTEYFGTDATTYFAQWAAAGVNLPSPASKPGHTFGGWYTDPGFTAFAGNAGAVYTPVSNITLYAKWNVNNYTVTFNTDGGTDIATATYAFGSAVISPTEPKKTGYTFIGWSPSLPALMPAENLIVTAQWSVNKYTIGFNSDGGTAVADAEYYYGDAVSTPASPVKDGYTFKGWSPALPSTMPAKNLTLTALWDLNNYTIAFNTDGGSTVNSITQGYNTVITAPANPTKEGCSFAEWTPAIPARMPLGGITVKAVWEINKYTVTFDTDGGSAISAVTDYFGTPIEAPANPTKEGYTFLRWDKDIPATVPAENITVKAIWQVNRYTVTFDTDGGTAIPAVTDDFGTPIVPPANPLKEGHTFVRWDTEIPATVPAVNITVKAVWSVNNYTITLKDGDTVLDTLTYAYGADIEAIENPEKTGYTFNVWDAEIPETMPANNIVLSAIWTVNSYTITLKDGETVLDTLTYAYGADIEAIENPEKTGHTFKAWDAEIPETMPANNLTFNASWTVNNYAVTFKDGDTVLNTFTLAYGADVTAIENPEKTGHTFKGWDAEIPGTMPASNLTFNAVWTVNSYTITLKDGETVLGTFTYAYGADIEEIENPEKTGHTFKAWDAEIPETMPANDLTFNASWTVNNYTVTFKDGDTVLNTFTLAYGADIEAIENPEKTGHTFKAWDAEIPETMPASNLTFNAVWTVNNYTITLKDGETVLGTLTYAYGTDIEEIENPEKTGYTFKAWDAEIPETMPANSLTFNASWTVNNYTVTLKDGDTVLGTLTYTYGADIEAIENPEKTGHTFKAWDAEIPETMPANNLTFNASWTVNNYTVTFKDGDTVLGSFTYAYGADIEAVENPEKTGHTFKSWDVEIPVTMPANNLTFNATWTVNNYTVTLKDGDTVLGTLTYAYGAGIEAIENPEKTGHTFKAWDAEIPGTMPANNLTFNASWTVNNYTVTFKDGDTVLDSLTFAYGAEVTAIETPEKTGHTFKAWDAVIPGAMPANNLTFNAVWTVNRYTVTFDTLGGTPVAPIADDYGKAITAPADPTRNGYTFVSWDTEIPATVPAGDIKITAVWTANIYTITFDTDGGNTINPASYKTDSAVTAPADPVKEGYIFRGWTPAIPGTMPAGDITVKANWELGQFTVTFDTDGGTEIPAIKGYYGSAVTAPAAPEKEGHSFLFWDTAVPATIPGRDLTITAVWDAIGYTVIFRDRDGNPVGEPQVVDYGTAAVLPPDEPDYFDAVNHYTFRGWNAPEVIKRDTVITPEFTSAPHVFTPTSTTASCTESGSTVYICECGFSYTEGYIPAYGHKLVRNEAGDIQPTCTETGIKCFICTVCGEHSDIVVRELFHDFADEWITETEPTCTATGVARRHCTRCDAVTGEKIIPALGHRVGDWEPVIPATCTEHGTDICHCRFCDYTEERTTPFTDHIDEDGDHYCDVCTARFGVCICGSTVIHDQNNTFEYFLCLFVRIFTEIKKAFGLA